MAATEILEREVVFHRYYDPTTAQFVSVDPLINATSQPYEYVEDNPINSTDPTGLMLLSANGCNSSSCIAEVNQCGIGSSSSSTGQPPFGSAPLAAGVAPSSSEGGGLPWWLTPGGLVGNPLPAAQSVYNYFVQHPPGGPSITQILQFANQNRQWTQQQLVRLGSALEGLASDLAGYFG